MSIIQNINLNKTVDYSDDKIDYFICDGNERQLTDYSDIINKIKNASKIINIASTSKISDDIIDALYQNEKVNLYMIVKSFDSAKDTLERFDSKKPAIIREVASLENNFIIIDEISYVFINELSNKTNVFMVCDEKYTKDLSFIFQSYFWDHATKEKLVNTISDPIESPFPPIGNRDLAYVNVTGSKFDKCTDSYIPKDKRFIEILNNESENNFFNDEIKTSVYRNEKYTQIGKLIFLDFKFDFTNRWRLKNDSLEDIHLEDEIIPKNDDWNKIIKVIESENIDLGSVVSDTIENMEETQPKKFTPKQYIRSIDYYWNVLPPSKPDNAKKSSLYNEYDKLNDDYQGALKELRHQLNDLEKESGLLSGLFSGANRKAKQNLKKIDEYREKKLEKLNIIDLENLLSKEFKSFYEDILKSDKDFKYDVERQKDEKKWQDKKKEKEDSLGKKKNTLENDKNILSGLVKVTQQKRALKEKLSELRSSVKSLQSKDAKYDASVENKKITTLENEEKALKDNPKEQTKLEKSIKNYQNDIQRIEKEIADDYTNYKYTPKKNEIKNTQKSNEKGYKQLKLPKYALPEVGILYETQKEYFLEITDDSDLKKANELRQRYEDKAYKVVVGDNNE